jgi:endonuclease YncB( thermonuclease family)
MSDWSEYNLYNTESFNFNDLETTARCIRIYDGDTIFIVLNIPGTKMYYKWSCRLNGIDSFEIKNTNEALKNKAHEALLFVYNFITKKEVPDVQDTKKFIEDDLNKNIYLINIKCGKFDKFGRILIDVLQDNVNLSDLLIENKLAYPYYGKTKLNQDEQLMFIME